MGRSARGGLWGFEVEIELGQSSGGPVGVGGRG